MGSLEIKWKDTDPATGERRYLRADRFARVWTFSWKLQRRGFWNKGLEPTVAFWEHILEGLQRRYWRREGVELDDIKEVEKYLREARQKEGPPTG